jgi:plastocyanin
MPRTSLALLSSLVLALGAAGCGGDDEDEPAAAGGGTATQEPAPAQPTTTPDGALRIGMQDLEFVPETAEAKVGQKVTWVNDESIPHNVVAEEGADFKSDIFGEGGEFSYVPREAGTIAYVCTLHPGMDGTLTVTR